MYKNKQNATFYENTTDLYFFFAHFYKYVQHIIFKNENDIKTNEVNIHEKI